MFHRTHSHDSLTIEPTVCLISLSWASHVALVIKNPLVNAGDGRDSSISGLGRSSGEGNGNPLQYSCLESSMDKGVWQVIVHGPPRVGHD